jgi:uncharacterized protein with HEPN domain
MPRDSRVYLEDAQGRSREAFADDERTLDAVVRNLEVIGEPPGLETTVRSILRN